MALAGLLIVPSAPTAWGQASAPAQQQAARTDADIQSDVAYAVTHDPALQGQQISAFTSHGIVTLTGTVQTEQQRQAAETAAANVQGVSAIQNNITVAGPSENSGNQAQEPPPPPDEQAAPAQPGNPQQNAGPAMGNPPPPPPPSQTPAARPAYTPQPSYGQGNYGNYPAPQQIAGPVTVPAGTLLQVRTAEPLDMSKLQDGATFQATAASDVFEGNVLAIPRGALLQGTVIAVRKPGSLGGNGELQVQITGLNLGGRMYPVTTDIWSSKTPNKAGYTAGNTAGGAIVGAIIGGIIGRGPGAAAGAIVGGGAGMAASAATNPRSVILPETLLNFHLASPVTLQPVSWQEAQRLAHNAEPQLQRRRVIYMAPPYPYPYGYPYPYPYYRVYGW